MKEPSSAYKISYNQVDNTNFTKCFSQIIKKMNASSHIALDLEFTALAHVKTNDMNHRYVAMKKTVENAAIVEIGLSIFKHKESNVRVKTHPQLSTTLSCFKEEKLVEEEEQDLSIPSTQPLPKTTSSSLFTHLVSSSSSSQQQQPSTSKIKTTTITTTVTLKQENIEPSQQFVQEYECDNFNLLTLKQGKFEVESSTGKFLNDHGFSFDRLFSNGIPFTPPTQDINQDENNTVDRRLKNLLKHMMGMMRFHHVPLILHNGLYDLMYIYHSFIGELPSTLSKFIIKVSDAFPSGIYDTRYLADQCDFYATFLPYVFNKADRMRQERYMKSTLQKPYIEVDVRAPIFMMGGVKRKRSLVVEEKAPIIKKQQPIDKKDDEELPYCEKFAERGYCDNKDHTASNPLHDVQVILDYEMGVSPYTQVYTSKSDHILYGAHAAHFDAYMTAFSYCYFCNTLPASVLKSSLNKMMISGLPFPLIFPVKPKHHQTNSVVAKNIAIRSTQ